MWTSHHLSQGRKSVVASRARLVESNDNLPWACAGKTLLLEIGDGSRDCRYGAILAPASEVTHASVIRFLRGQRKELGKHQARFAAKSHRRSALTSLLSHLRTCLTVLSSFTAEYINEAGFANLIAETHFHLPGSRRGRAAAPQAPPGIRLSPSNTTIGLVRSSGRHAVSTV